MGIILDESEEKIKALEQRIESLFKGYQQNRDRIKAIQMGLRVLLAVVMFGAIVWGIPIVEVKWSGTALSITKGATSTELIIAATLVSAAIVSGEKPIDLIKLVLQKNKT